jgi:methionyl-tRNA formyltransferase
MGTPDFAVESLKVLNEANQNIVGVITAPDKPSGRGQKVIASPVKVFAQNIGIQKILQPENLKSPEFVNTLKALKPDLQIVVAFRMLPESIWTLPIKGTVNLHASLLPDYRGAAPINWVIINGEKETGVTTFFIDKEIDTGKIIYAERVSIETNTTAGELHDKLKVIGANLLVRTVESIAQGINPSVSQTENAGKKELHMAPKIFKEQCQIDWTNEGIAVSNFIRGLSPYPAAWTEMSNDHGVLHLKIFETTFEKVKHNQQAGMIVVDRKDTLKITVSDGFIELKSIQQAGKKRIKTEEFLRGRQDIESFKLHS